MQRVVKPLINGRVLVFTAILSAAGALLMFGLSYWLTFGDFSGEPGFPWTLVQALLLAFAIVFVLLAIGSTWGAWSMLRLERRRQVAAREGSTHNVLATEQPSAHTVPLSQPMIIGMRTKWPMKLIAWPWVALLVIAASANEALDHGIWDVRVFLALLVALGTGAFFARLFTGERQIEVTDDQLTVCVGSLEETVPWETARLFAITSGRHATVHYELSSSQARADWIWVRPGTFSARLYGPTIPQDEYDRQMEALLALIAAKTGLLLQDLR
jgi:hypothetical protein